MKSLFKEKYRSLTFVTSHLTCPRCGSAVQHSRTDVEDHAREASCLALAKGRVADEADRAAEDMLSLYRRKWGLE